MRVGKNEDTTESTHANTLKEANQEYKTTRE